MLEHGGSKKKTSPAAGRVHDSTGPRTAKPRHGGGGASAEDSGQDGNYGNEQGGDGEGNRFGEPEDGSESEDRETGADLCCGVGVGIRNG